MSKKKINSCPLCGESRLDYNYFSKNLKLSEEHTNFQHIIYKHLQIEIADDHIENVCPNCKQTVDNWDEFAKKCWETQNILKEAENDGKIEIKIEKQPDEPESKDIDEKWSSDKILNIKIDLDEKKSIAPLKHQKKSVNKKPKQNTKKCDKNEQNNTTEKIETKKTDFVDFSCYICSAKMSNWANLSQHFVEDHPGSKAKVLCICGKYLGCRRAVQIHTTLHDESKALKCEECGKKFGNMNSYKEHMLIHFPDKDYRFSCSYCSKKFFQRAVYELHEKTHLPPELKDTFACDICGDKISSKLGLQAHYKTKHEGQKNHVCDMCGKSFTLKGNLKLHLKSVHTDAKNFECDKCLKKFKNQKYLRKHQSTVHFNKQLQCPLCPAVLKTVRTFQKHKDIHENVYRHACKICGRKFRNKNNLKTHMYDHNHTPNDNKINLLYTFAT